MISKRNYLKRVVNPLFAVGLAGLTMQSCGQKESESKTNWMVTASETTEEQLPEFAETKAFAIIPFFGTVQAETFEFAETANSQVKTKNQQETSEVEIFVSPEMAKSSEEDTNSNSVEEGEEEQIPVRIIRGNPNPVERLYAVECTSSKLPLKKDSSDQEPLASIQSSTVSMDAFEKNAQQPITELFPELGEVKSALMKKQKGEALSSAVENLYKAQFALQNQNADLMPEECVLYGEGYDVLAYDYARLKMLFESGKGALGTTLSAGLAGGFFFMGVTSYELAKGKKVKAFENAKMGLIVTGTILAVNLFKEFLKRMSPLRRQLKGMIDSADKPLQEQSMTVASQYQYLKVKQELLWFMESFNKAEYERLIKMSAFSKPIEIPE